VIPTNYLRFINAETRENVPGTDYYKVFLQKRLQQWWSGKGEGPGTCVEYEPGHFPCRGEWRDVELVTE